MYSTYDACIGEQSIGIWAKLEDLQSVDVVIKYCAELLRSLIVIESFRTPDYFRPSTIMI